MDDYIAWISDLLSPFGAVRTRKMFGGYAVYLNDRGIAIIHDDEIFFKADRENEAKFAEADGVKFSYYRRQKPVEMNYWSLPSKILEDPDRLKPMVALSVETAKRTEAKKARRTSRKK